MTEPAPHPQRTNLNTWLSIAGFALTIIGGSVALGRFQSETETGRAALVVQIETLKQQQATDVLRIEARSQALETSIDNLEIRDARNDEQLTAMRETLLDLKTSQAETNRLLRDLKTNGVGP